MPEYLDPNELAAQISGFSVQPFQDLLAHYLQCRPDQDSIREAAKKSPDRYAQALSMLGRLSGYRTESPVVQNNLFMVIQGMSDSQLREMQARLDREYTELMAQREQPDPPVIRAPKKTTRSLPSDRSDVQE